MDSERLLSFIDKWGKYIGFLSGLAALLTKFFSVDWAFYMLIIVFWLLVCAWLWSIAKQRKVVRGAILIGSATLPKVYTDSQRKLAASGIGVLTLFVWGWVGWQVFSNIPQTPKLSVFPEEKFGIIIAEFTQGAEERRVFEGGADVRDKIFSDLERLIAQQGLSNRVLVQQSGPIENREESLKLGEKYNADLVIWGYIPINQPNSFRPSFDIISSNEELQTIDPILFGVEITGDDGTDANVLLTTRVKVVSSFILGMVYLTEGESENYDLALLIFNQAIGEALVEWNNQPQANQSDYAFNLALLHLVRGRTYAALGDEEKALDDYTEAISYWADYPRAYVAMGNVYYARREFDKASQFYEKATTSWQGIYGLGLVAYHQSNFDLAIQDFQEALSIANSAGIKPGGMADSVLTFTLGMAHKQKGELQNAEELLSKVCNSTENLVQDFREGVCRELDSVYATQTSTLAPLTGTPEPSHTPMPSPMNTPTQPRAEFASTETILPTDTQTATVSPTFLPLWTFTPTKKPKEPTLLPTARLTDPPPPPPTLLPTTTPPIPTLLPTPATIPILSILIDTPTP